MRVFDVRNQLVNEYSRYVESFIEIRDDRIRNLVSTKLEEGMLWPDPLVQLNPAFKPGAWIDALVEEEILHSECLNIFKKGKSSDSGGEKMRLHFHQEEALRTAKTGENYILTTGTGSGKSLSYIIPIVDHVLRKGSGNGIKAIIVYPMNALANSQYNELEKFLCHGYPDGKPPVRFESYTGQEDKEKREKIIENPPDIILTNYVMLEYILTRVEERKLVDKARGLKYIVLDELHTYRGRQGADVAMLLRRLHNLLGAEDMQVVGTSATLSTAGNFYDQQSEIARVASRLFGREVKGENVIGETLERSTPLIDFSTAESKAELLEAVKDSSGLDGVDYRDFTSNPLASWIESTFGLQEESETNRLIRVIPRSISGKNGAALKLSDLTGADVDDCNKAIETALLAGYQVKFPESGFPVFAFRLHQFIGKGDTVYASIADEDNRYITTNAQKFVPGDRERILLPLCFCRECGQEFYTTSRVANPETGHIEFIPRKLNDRTQGENSQPGFLYINTKSPWPEDSSEELLDRLPPDWLEDRGGRFVVRQNRKKDLPESVGVNPNGSIGGSGINIHFLGAPFRFCPSCGVSFDFRVRSDFGKLAELSSEGRSTATTILGMTAIASIREESTLPEKAHKLLSFTDNRQDAALQAGHFNDFVQIGLLRSALYKAAETAGEDGISHEFLTTKVFDALGLSKDQYASSAEAASRLHDESTRNALKDVLGYRLYRDLMRGWRVTAPNLEQSGLLKIDYKFLDEECQEQEKWQNLHPALVSATPKVREKVCRVLLDLMRRELLIRVKFLDNDYLNNTIKELSSQYLKSPWDIDAKEKLEFAGIMYPRSKQQHDSRVDFFVSSRSGFAQYLKRQNTFPDHAGTFDQNDLEAIIQGMLDFLAKCGYVEVVQHANSDNQVNGYQLAAHCIVWKAGDGSSVFHDPIRTPNVPKSREANEFFVRFYKAVASKLLGMEAHEHTAQVQSEDRVEREKLFREGKLPVLFCSPTMELGVDISELNLVNMRNVPPTPANYAQRSGRAGRSGQPALVFTYCTSGSSHDQYFYQRPERMVAGQVVAPRIDLANEDLVRAHVHSIWLTATGMSLGRSLKDLLDLDGDEPSLKLLPSVLSDVSRPAPRGAAKSTAKTILVEMESELIGSDWYSDQWIDEVCDQIQLRFEDACERWRTLYRSALTQFGQQSNIIREGQRNQQERNEAKRLRREAEAQLELLRDTSSAFQSDFYSYRYFASEGFLPGYNFPRLPLSAYIPARRGRSRDDFLSRPRFLAISEFGPRSFVYHEGSRYIINGVIMPVGEGDVATQMVKLCGVCGYRHVVSEGSNPDRCEHCNNELGPPIANMFRMENVVTKRRDNINCDEEERLRMGFEIVSCLRFSEQGGSKQNRSASVSGAEGKLATLYYGSAADIWRINKGLRRRKDQAVLGFDLDTERGYWAKNQQNPDDEDDPLSNSIVKVVPFVQDRRNSLLFEPAVQLEEGQMASLQAALKRAIQLEYELEDNELAAEPLPSRDQRNLILLYESSEGGAGVLRQFIDNPDAWGKVCLEAIALCHFDPDSGEDFGKDPKSEEECEAACYDCLMSYGNQLDHQQLDRKNIHEFLTKMSRANVEASPVEAPRSEHLAKLMDKCDSNLEKNWLRLIESKNLRLPEEGQFRFPPCKTKSDFYYSDAKAVIYVDGPPHDFPERQERDARQQQCLENKGYTVIRFHHQDDWEKIIAEYPSVFS